MKLVRVEWWDAASTAEWAFKEDLLEPVDVTTVGYLARDDEAYIVICASLTDGAQLGDCIAIPKGIILKQEDVHA